MRPAHQRRFKRKSVMSNSHTPQLVGNGTGALSDLEPVPADRLVQPLTCLDHPALNGSSAG